MKVANVKKKKNKKRKSLILAPLLLSDSNIENSTDLVPILDLCCGSVVGFLKEDLLHFAVLQIVQLSHRILGPLDKIHQHRVWTLTLQKRMLDKKEKTEQWERRTPRSRRSEVESHGLLEIHSTILFNSKVLLKCSSVLVSGWRSHVMLFLDHKLHKSQTSWVENVEFPEKEPVPYISLNM